MNGNGVGWKNCKTCENTVKSLKSMHSFTLSQAVQWAEFHSSLGLVWSPGLLFKTPDIENSKCVTVFTAVRCNPQTSHHGEKCSNPDVHEGWEIVPCPQFSVSASHFFVIFLSVSFGSMNDI